MARNTIEQLRSSPVLITNYHIELPCGQTRPRHAVASLRPCTGRGFCARGRPGGVWDPGVPGDPPGPAGRGQGPAARG